MYFPWSKELDNKSFHLHVIQGNIMMYGQSGPISGVLPLHVAVNPSLPQSNETGYICIFLSQMKSSINTLGPLYNMVHYNTVFDITVIIVGPQLVILYYFYYVSIHITLVITPIR